MSICEKFLTFSVVDNHNQGKYCTIKCKCCGIVSLCSIIRQKLHLISSDNHNSPYFYVHIRQTLLTSHLEFLSFSCPRCHPNFSHPLQVGKAFLHMFCLQKKDSFHRAKSYLNKKWNHLCQLSAGANVCFWKSYCVQKTVVTASALPASCCSCHKNGDFRLFSTTKKKTLLTILRMRIHF